VGRYAAERTLSRLGSRKIPTTECPVLFESPLAAGLLGSFVQAVSGSALYRKSTFLLDSLGKPIFSKHIDIEEDPFVLGGKGSSPFDEEGVRVQARNVVELMGQGVNYVTGDYSRGASGFWVENGEIAFPVDEITIAGNMKDMFKGIEAIGADAYNYGAKTVGSILVNRMKVAGS